MSGTPEVDRCSGVERGDNVVLGGVRKVSEETHAQKYHERTVKVRLILYFLSEHAV